MAVRKFQLSDVEARELALAFENCRNADTKIRFQAVRLYGQGYPVTQIQDICGCHQRSLLRWCSDYQQGGIAALTDHRKGGNRAKLSSCQIQRVEHLLHGYTPAQLLGKDAWVGDGQFWTVPDVTFVPERDYALTYQSRASYQSVLRKCGLSYQRPVPASCQAVQVAQRFQGDGLRGGAGKKS